VINIIVYKGRNYSNEEDYGTKLITEFTYKRFLERGFSPKDALKGTSELIKKKKKELFTYHGYAWDLGSKSLEFFCMWYLRNIYVGDDKADLAPIHTEIWKELQDAILNGTPDKLEYLLPRGTGKSTFISLGIAIWCSVYKFKSYTVIASAIGDTAETFIRNIKIALEGNNRIINSFGELYNPKKCIVNAEKIEFSNKCMIQSISASSTLRGKSYANTRIELLLLDDYQKDEEVATQEQRDKKWKRFNDDVKYAIQKNNCTMVAVGTVQNQDCFYNRLRNLPTWKVRHEKGVLLDDVDTYFTTGLWEEFRKILFNRKEFKDNALDYAKEFYFQHESEMQYPLLWQSFWDCLDMAISYFENPVSFKQEVQGDTSCQGEKRFKNIETETKEEIESHNYINTILTIDPANSLSNTADFSAFCVGSRVQDGTKYIRKAIIDRLDRENYINKTIELLKQYPDISRVWIEKNLYMGFDLDSIKSKMSKDPLLKYRKIEFENTMQRSNKFDKIDGITGEVNLGKVIFNEEDTEAIQQIKEYVGAKSPHDDMPDCLAECLQRLEAVKTLGTIRFFDPKKIFG
jgi:predicted phage terminase large subunit-like protein